MKVVGIDPSSACIGYGLVEGKDLLRTDTWEPDGGSAPERLLFGFEFMVGWLIKYRPDMACIESLSVERNAKTTRIVSHYQALAVIACKRQGLVVVECRATSARKVVFGRGDFSKRETYDKVREMFPDHDFGRWNEKKNGGPAGDRSDAVTLALAGPSAAERS